MTVSDWLDRAQARTDCAADGPWEAREVGRGGRVYEPSGFPLPGCFNCGENDAVYEMADAEFIAAARTDLPAAIAALRAVLAEAEVADSDATLGAGEPQIGYVPSNHLRRAIAAALGTTP